jgi:hypothetical protein
MDRALNKLNLVYYSIFSITILVTVIGYFFVMNGRLSMSVTVSVVHLSTIILATYLVLSSILGFGLFYSAKKKLNKIDDEYIKVNTYVNFSNLRLLFIGIGLIGGIIVFYFFRTIPLFICVVISALELFFCKPSTKKILKDLNLNDID